jgi:hypothetical protein
LNISDSDKNDNQVKKYKFKTAQRYCKICNFKNVNNMDKESLKYANKDSEICEKCGNSISNSLKLFVIFSHTFI